MGVFCPCRSSPPWTQLVASCRVGLAGLAMRGMVNGGAGSGKSFGTGTQLAVGQHLAVNLNGQMRSAKCQLRKFLCAKFAVYQISFRANWNWRGSKAAVGWPAWFQL